MMIIIHTLYEYSNFFVTCTSIGKKRPSRQPCTQLFASHAALYAEIWYTHLRVVQSYAADHFTQVAECRMYEQRFPEIDEVVMVQVRERSDLVTLKFDVYAKVKSIAEMGAYVELLEYDNVEGMILLSELTRRRIRSVSKLIKVNRSEVLWSSKHSILFSPQVGRIEPVMVLRVDKEKGYIDLSKRFVSTIRDLQNNDTL